jgi:hypothetical protein
VVRALAAVLTAPNEQMPQTVPLRHPSRNGSYLIMSSSGAGQMAAAQRFTVLEGQVDTRFSPHPDAEIILSRTRIGMSTRPPVDISGSRPTMARTCGPAD